MSAHYIEDELIKAARKDHPEIRSNRDMAARLAGGPATRVVRTEGGYTVFDYVPDYETWRRQV